MTASEFQAADRAEAERLAALIGGPCDHIRRTCAEIDCKMPRDVAAIAAALAKARQDEREAAVLRVEKLYRRYKRDGGMPMDFGRAETLATIRGSDAAR